MHFIRLECCSVTNEEQLLESKPVLGEVAKKIQVDKNTKE